MSNVILKDSCEEEVRNLWGQEASWNSFSERLEAVSKTYTSQENGL